jgi:tRNA (guanine37-N1)-methyltransferase
MPLTISIITIFEELYKPFLDTSLIGRARHNKRIEVSVNSLFSYVPPKQRIDAPVYGHSAGMLIRPDVLQKAIEDREQQAGKAFKIFFSPQGHRVDQHLLKRLEPIISAKGHVILVAPRYEGVDARAEETYADITLSVGDFVLMGGDIPALMFLEGFLRLVPGIVGRQESVEHDSFSGALVDYPTFTEPLVWNNKQVPDVVRSGNHEAIRQWELTQAAHRTIPRHFSWFRTTTITPEERTVVWKQIPNHYVVLLHSDVLIGDNQEGTTSVTSLDIHDIARSARTYGFKKFFIVTPLVDQQKVVTKLLDFWQNEEGMEYNKNRYEALSQVCLLSTLDEVVSHIEKQEGKQPVLVATSAHERNHEQVVTFFDQEKVWATNRPVLFVLGTGKGLCEKIINRSEFMLKPLTGFMDFNHLSVRSAAAILFDRWLGLNPRTSVQHSK